MDASELRILGALVVCAAAALAFFKVVNEIFLEDERGMDHAIILALRDPADATHPLGPAWVADVARDITSLGSVSVLTIVTAGALILLVLVGRKSGAIYAVSAIVTGTLLVQFLKTLFGRSRPDLVPEIAEMASKSFPSGHTSMSAIIYLTLAALIAREVPKVGSKIYVVCFGILLTGLVGMSRVYLGFHWPSDVVAGWALGAAWALLWWAGAEWLGQYPNSRS